MKNSTRQLGILSNRTSLLLPLNHSIVFRRLTSRLLQLGAKLLIPVGLGDDQEKLGYHTALYPWLSLLITAAVPVLGNRSYPTPLESLNPETVQSLVLPLDDPGYEVCILGNPADNEPLAISASKDDIGKGDEASKNMMMVVGNERLTSQDCLQDVKHVVLQYQLSHASPLPYRAGDVAAVRPRNDPMVVDRALARLCSGQDPNTVISATPLSHNVRAGKGRIGAVSCTLRELFSSHLDISGGLHTVISTLPSIHTPYLVDIRGIATLALHLCQQLPTPYS